MKKALVICFVLAGCTTLGGAVCSLLKDLAGGLSTEIARQGDCDHPEEIKADLEAQLNKLPICETRTESTAGDLLCGPAVEAGLSLVQSRLPEKYGCHGGPIKTWSRENLMDVCKRIL